ncbi:ROK family protein [Steroidobacter sp. S1-65]|uniref:ROK family protein n=1 Tax=Steroidobacter gossypii TaxID=2805490 RepID=A0ABS1X172_9GAMM|nr:ROK family protein [Steroidobacter gossypii]MBM0106988.1 ROK family protein [Steroidobacter gossypii]
MPRRNAKNSDDTPSSLLAHGGKVLSLVVVDAYNAEMRSPEGFLGDRASRRAFQAILDDWRDRVSRAGDDPLGELPSEEMSKKQLDKMLAQGDAEAAGVIHGAIEEFAQEFAQVIRRFLKLKGWQNTEALVVGGGLRQSRIGELAIGRTAVLLKADGVDLDIKPIHHHADHAGLIGCIQLVPSWILSGHDSILAVDIGGSNIRAGIVELRRKRAADFSQAAVGHFELWRHSEDQPDREDAVERLIQMLNSLIRRATKDGANLAPFIGIGCPGVIRSDGSIERGGQNLPGDWEQKSFNLPEKLRAAIPKIGDHETVIVMHNDAVVQGLSEAPSMRDYEHWGVLTIGTGLGNARFTNRSDEDDKDEEEEETDDSDDEE